MKRYYPRAIKVKVNGIWEYVEAIHEVRDHRKVRSLVRAVRRGDAIPPIVIWGSRLLALNGTHRMAANDLLERLGDDRRIPVVDFDDMDLTPEQDEAIIDAVDNSDYEWLDTAFDDVAA